MNTSIIDFVKATTLKGQVDVGDNFFRWELGDVELHFCIDLEETIVEYYSHFGEKIKCVGHTHVDNCDLINLIQDINNESNMIKITASLLGSSFAVVDKNSKKEKSTLFVRRLYSI